MSIVDYLFKYLIDLGLIDNCVNLWIAVENTILTQNSRLTWEKGFRTKVKINDYSYWVYVYSERKSES